MKKTPEILALDHALTTCNTHEETLRDTLSEISLRSLDESEIDHLEKQDRRLLDQFAYRYTRLQDDMGAKLIPAILRALGEEIAAIPVMERLNRMEQLIWLPSADEWSDLRRIRNEFTHDYPESAHERYERLQLAFTSARRLTEILSLFRQKIDERFEFRGL